MFMLLDNTIFFREKRKEKKIRIFSCQIVYIEHLDNNSSRMYIV